MSGTQISDMTLAALPIDGQVPFIVLDTTSGLNPQANYRADLGALLASIGYLGPVVTTATLQAALTYVGANGGTLIIPPGTLNATSQLTLRPTTVNGIHILGYGAEITTTGPISGLKIFEAFNLPAQVVVEGLKVNHRGNSTATAGFELQYSSHVTFRNCEVEAHGTSATYAGFWFHNGTAANDDTGCFWNTLDSCTLRKRSGGDGPDMTYGVKLQGASNASKVVNCSINNCQTGIYILPEAAQTTLSNRAVIDNTDFESLDGGAGIAMRVQGAAASTGITGLRVTNCSAEAVDTFLFLGGSTVDPGIVPFLAGNWSSQDLNIYIDNAETLGIESYDRWLNPSLTNEQTHINATATVFVATSGGEHGLIARGGGGGRGLAIQEDAGNIVGTFAWTGTGTLSRIAGVATSEMAVSNTRGISATPTDSNNLRGTATFAAGTTVAVAFGTAEPDANYTVQLTPKADPVGRLWTSSLATGGFTINNSSSTSIAVDWLLIR